jgi:phenylalanyl-tRNA synthetase beta chain
VRQVEALLRRVGGALVEDVAVESDYRGSELPAGTRSVAFRISFRAADRTLRDSEVDEAEARLVAALANELDIQRRDGGSRTEG